MLLPQEFFSFTTRSIEDNAMKNKLLLKQLNVFPLNIQKENSDGVFPYLKAS